MKTIATKSSVPGKEDQKKLLEKAFLLMQDGIVCLDKKGRILFINKVGQTIFEKKLGKKPKAGDCFMSLVRPEMLDRTRKTIHDAFHNKETITELMYPQLGKETWFELAYFPMPESNGATRYICVRARDISEKVFLERKLLKQRKAQKNRIIKATIDAQDQERAQIGRELHDNINQSLTTARLYCEICLDHEKTNRELLNKTILILNSSIQEIRNLSKQLSYPSYETTNMKELIMELVEAVNRTQKVAIQLITREQNKKLIPQDIQTALYRITQEQLTNILKHAQATLVDLVIVSTSKSISLQIQDNGRGFDMQQKRKGVGLTNILSRVEALDGTLDLYAKPGKGCRLTVEFPL